MNDPCERQHIHHRPTHVRYFYDSEFIEDGITVDPISIGIVSEDDRELYLCNSECDLSRANDWVKQNVIPYLPPRDSILWVTKKQMRDAVLEFVTGKPEFWVYYGSYDWQVLCQLFGRMIDLPEHFPKHPMDLKQYSVMIGSPPNIPQTSTEHIAIEDARWNRELFHYLRMTPGL